MGAIRFCFVLEISGTTYRRVPAAINLAAGTLGSELRIRIVFLRADAPLMTVTSERGTPATFAINCTSSAFAFPRAGGAATAITKPRGSTLRISLFDAPGRARTSMLKPSAAMCIHGGLPLFMHSWESGDGAALE